MDKQKLEEVRQFANSLIAHPVAFGTIDHTEHAGEMLREAADEIERLHAELQYARDGLTKGRTRMSQDLERHKPLVQAVKWVVEEGHMYPEDLARLRAALDGLGPNKEFSGVPAGHSSNHPAGGTSAATQG